MRHLSLSRIALLLGLVGLLAGPPAMAADAAAAAGVVKRASGAVALHHGAQAPAQALTPGQTVRVGDVIRTGADGSAGITLADDTLLAVGANSELVLSEFAFDPTTHDGGVLISLWRGTLSVISGLIGKKSPEQVKVQTRSVVLGVRGTEFIVDAGEGSP